MPCKSYLYKPSPQKMKHVHAVLQMMSIMTGDHRFEDAYNDAIQKEELNMCEVLDYNVPYKVDTTRRRDCLKC